MITTSGQARRKRTRLVNSKAHVRTQCYAAQEMKTREREKVPQACSPIVVFHTLVLLAEETHGGVVLLHAQSRWMVLFSEPMFRREFSPCSRPYHPPQMFAPSTGMHRLFPLVQRDLGAQDNRQLSSLEA